jgi:protein ImuA
MFLSSPRTETLARLRAQIARIAHAGGAHANGAPGDNPRDNIGDNPRDNIGDNPAGTAWTSRAIPFGTDALDRALPAGGLLAGALHEVAGSGPDTEHGAAAAQFLAGVLARTEGPVLWVQQRADLFAPGLAGAGLDPSRIVFAEAGKQVLAAMEEGLAHPGLAAVVGEFSGRLSLVASRRLQLAAEKSGVLAALLRRGRVFDDPELSAPSAAVTRWRITARVSPPPLPHAPTVPGLGPALWRLELTHCRGGEPGSWMVEACDATGRLALVTGLAHGPAEETTRRSA